MHLLLQFYQKYLIEANGSEVLLGLEFSKGLFLPDL